MLIYLHHFGHLRVILTHPPTRCTIYSFILLSAALLLWMAWTDLDAE